MATDTEQYPECEKLSVVSTISQAQKDFVDFLREGGLALCRYSEKRGQYLPEYVNLEKELAAYHDIDLDKVEKERQQMIANLR